MTNEELTNYLTQVCNTLGEHVDAVQILVTSSINGNTGTMCYGIGNWHARVGMARHFVLEDQSRILTNQLQSIIEDSKSDGEE